MSRSSQPLVRVHRGPRVESVHRGSIVVVRGDRVVFAWGDPDDVVYYRSASKSLQALVGVTSGAVDAMGIDDEMLAIAAGSHNAEPRHLEVVEALLAKAGLDASALQCGGHYSIDKKLAFEQRKRVPKDPPAIWSNCSGKHALMLATAVHLGLPIETYLDPAHPVQQEIRRHIALLAGIEPSSVEIGCDNCGTPAFALPLRAMAVSLARFARPASIEPALARACRRVARATLDHPFHVGGTRRFDTDLMEIGGRGLLAKAGAEGVHAWAVVDEGLAMAVKVDDGHDRGYRLPVIEILEGLGRLDADGAARLRERHADPRVLSFAGLIVGRLEVALDDRARAALSEAARVS